MLKAKRMYEYWGEQLIAFTELVEVMFSLVRLPPTRRPLVRTLSCGRISVTAGCARRVRRQHEADKELGRRRQVG